MCPLRHMREVRRLMVNRSKRERNMDWIHSYWFGNVLIFGTCGLLIAAVIAWGVYLYV